MSETETFAWAAVVAPHAAAATAARDILIEGGNAIEAAVAASAVLSVVMPQTAGAGGDGVWTIRAAGPRGRTRVLDARGPLGAAATLRRFRERGFEAVPTQGPDAILSVPGAPAGWRAALDLSRALGGKLPEARLLEAAIAAARDGFAASDPALCPVPPGLDQQPGFAATFLVDGKRPEVGALCRAPGWGETLRYLAESGLEDVYRGDVAREIARDLQAMDGLLTRDDLRAFEPRWREPSSLRCGFGLIEGPASQAALTMLVGIGIFERLAAARAGSAAHLHNRIEAMKHAATMLRDAESGATAEDLLASERLQAEADGLDAVRAAPGGLLPRSGEAGAGLGIIDAQGLAVSLALSLGTAFGSGCVLAKTGLLVGNRGARFEIDDDNGLALRPGRRAPMDGVPMVIAGDRGGVLCLAVSDWPLGLGMVAQLGAGVGLGETVGTPRLVSCAVPGSDGAVVLAEDGFDPSVLSSLSRGGHEIRAMDRVQAGSAVAVRRFGDGRVEAAPDPRVDGKASGL